MRRTFIALSVLLAIFYWATAQGWASDCSRAETLAKEATEVMGKYPASAELLLRSAVDACEQSAALHYNLGGVLFMQKKYQESASSLERALELRPGFAQGMNVLANVHLEMEGGSFIRAEELARNALQIDPRNRGFNETMARVQAMRLDKDKVDAPPRTSLTRPNAVAVVIGNASYQRALVPAVQYAVRDASIVKDYLVQALGFRETNILYYEDARLVDFKSLFGDESNPRGLLYTRTKPELTDVFVYYSGHGVPDTNTQKSYLLPADGDPNMISLTGYAMDTLYANLDKLNRDKRPKSITVVFDACFSGSSPAGALVSEASSIGLKVRPVAPIPGDNIAILTSATENQISSWYTQQRHGLFTYFFLKFLKEGIVSGQDVALADMQERLVFEGVVNDHALQLFNREQNPKVHGNLQLILAPKADLLKEEI